MRASEGQSTRSRGQAESPSLDLSIEHHLSGGLRRSSSELSAVAARRCDRQRERGGEDDAGERRGMTGRADRAAGRVRPEGAGADRWAKAGREREKERFLSEN
jgi:hypothetical protein